MKYEKSPLVIALISTAIAAILTQTIPIISENRNKDWANYLLLQKKIVIKGSQHQAELKEINYLDGTVRIMDGPVLRTLRVDDQDILTTEANSFPKNIIYSIDRLAANTLPWLALYLLMLLTVRYLSLKEQN